MAPDWWRGFGDTKPDSTAPAGAVLETLDDASKYGIKIPDEDGEEALVNERLQALADYLIQYEEDVVGL